MSKRVLTRSAPSRRKEFYSILDPPYRDILATSIGTAYASSLHSTRHLIFVYGVDHTNSHYISICTLEGYFLTLLPIQCSDYDFHMRSKFTDSLIVMSSEGQQLICLDEYNRIRTISHNGGPIECDREENIYAYCADAKAICVYTPGLEFVKYFWKCPNKEIVLTLCISRNILFVLAAIGGGIFNRYSERIYRFLISTGERIRTVPIQEGQLYGATFLCSDIYSNAIISSFLDQNIVVAYNSGRLQYHEMRKEETRHYSKISISTCSDEYVGMGVTEDFQLVRVDLCGVIRLYYNIA